MYLSFAWLNALLATRRRCPDWQRVPIALAVIALVLTGFALAVTLGGSDVHHGVSASSVAWGRQ